MSSFYKTTQLSSSVNGTILKNNLIYVSSGIPSLDHVIGGGLPSGAILAVEEDVLGNYSRVLTKYFLAEGVVCQHSLLIAFADENPQDIIKELPLPCQTPTEDEIPNAAANLEKMKIAWRYEGLGQVESSFGSNTNLGHHFDLSKHIDEGTVKKCNITFCDPNCDQTDVSGFKNGMYLKLLTNIKEAIIKQNNEMKSKNILRISIQSLGSPIWMAGYEDSDTGAYGKDLLKFMYTLRVLIRDSNAVVFITIPSHLFDDDQLMKRLLYSIDNSVKIESFAGSSRETNPVYKDYHGLFHITKLSAIHSMNPFVPPSDLAFKLKRKKFVIEKLHLPPELQDSSEREQDDITATPQVACGGFKKKDIDF